MSATKTTKGLLGTKLGMTQVWDENNKLIPVTVVQITPNVVTQVRTRGEGRLRRRSDRLRRRSTPARSTSPRPDTSRPPA